MIEGEDVEICITVTNGVSLDSSLGHANFTLSLSSSPASGLLLYSSHVLNVMPTCINVYPIGIANSMESTVHVQSCMQ